MSEDDKKAAFLLLELAEQGRPIEVWAQWIASYIRSGGDDEGVMLTDYLSNIFARTTELLNQENLIWNGLLPSGFYTPEWEVTKIESDDDDDGPDDRWKAEVSFLYDGNVGLEERLIFSESPLNEAEWVIGRIHHLATPTEQPLGWSALFEFKNGSNYLMTYEVAQLIVQMGKANDLWAVWEGRGDPLYADDAYQAISDDMAGKATEFLAGTQQA